MYRLSEEGGKPVLNELLLQQVIYCCVRVMRFGRLFQLDDPISFVHILPCLDFQYSFFSSLCACYYKEIKIEMMNYIIFIPYVLQLYIWMIDMDICSVINSEIQT